jgi:ABC-type antimicrobial peptide transport system permease subunit
MEDVIAASMARLSFTSLLLAVAAATALLLAAVGLYGVVSYAVTRRTREIGMRMAIGARPGQVEWMVVAQSLLLVGLGLAVGLAAALAGTRVLEGLLYGVEPTEPRAFAAAAALLTAVALLASWIPARRAARVDPSEALREV